MNETLKNIEERFSCRSYLSDMISDSDIKLILDSALSAPSGINRQPWQVIFVKNTNLIKEMDAVGLKFLEENEKDAYDRLTQRGGTLFYNAPCMAVIAIKDKNALVDLGIIAQNIVLSATSLGISSVHCGLANAVFLSNKSDYYKNKLGINDGYEFGLAVLLGYPKEKTLPHVRDYSKISIIE